MRGVLLAGKLIAPTVVLGQSSQPTEERPDTPEGPAAIQQQQPSFLVRVDVNHATRAYREGDHLSVRISSEVDALAYVVYQQADGKIFQIYPNNHQPDNRLQARQAIQIPAVDDLFRWRIGPPFGKELIKVIASKEPINALAHPALKQKQFNPLSKEALKGVELELGEETPPSWAEDQIEITTYAGQELESSAAKRWGVFVGVSDYEFNTEKEQASKGKSSLNLPACHRDARKMADVLRESGQLSDVRIYTNQLATRSNIELAVTRWLPSVSRAGDTVFIYFSGHGMQIPDDNGDEADRQDELLVPYDYLGADILGVLLKRAEENKLEASLAPRVAAALQVVKKAASLEKGAEELSRQMAVSDDLFGHWLQSLSGRQVVVILDVCHAGGFAAAEKDLFAPAKAIPFDFLEGEIGRLKDIGQPDSALLAACAARELSLVRRQQDLSVMTFYLVRSLEQSPSSLSLEQAAGLCNAGMHDYFAELNRHLQTLGQPARPGHQLQLMNNCRQPVLIKP
jgi:hypothetical protein